MEWIEVKSEKPSSDHPVLIYYVIPEEYRSRCIVHAYVDVGWYDPSYDKWFAESIDYDGFSSSRVIPFVTHWMSLPKPPNIEIPQKT